jgi:hypothetical protein
VTILTETKLWTDESIEQLLYQVDRYQDLFIMDADKDTGRMVRFCCLHGRIT